MRRRDLLAAVLIAMDKCVDAVAKKRPPAKPVNINAAGVDELATLPGIGAMTARAIVRYREKNGPFRKPEELLLLRGISRARLRVLLPHIRLK